MLVTPIHTRVFQEGENLFSFITSHVKKIPENAVLVVTSKIVALAEGRTISNDPKTKEKIIKSESAWAKNTKYVWLTLTDGMLMANAGIDESNANGKLILLPKDSFASAKLLWKKLRAHYGLKTLGIVITDSHTYPLRAGTTGVALGYAGFKGIKDYRGIKDIFGRAFHFSRVSVADGLAAAAVLAMGEGAERMPLALITDAPVVFTERIQRSELVIPPADDMYAPLFKGFRTKK